MAIAMAQLGGMGIIHKNMDIAHQARRVRHVKSLKQVRWQIRLLLPPMQRLAICLP